MCARAEAGPVGPKRGLAAVPTRVGGAWQGFESTRRAKLAARTAEAGGQAARRSEICRATNNKQKDRRPRTHQADRPAGQHTRRPQHPWGRNTTQQPSSPTRRVGITKPPGPTGAGRFGQYQ